VAFSIRAALPEDVPEILALVRELAEYEKLSHAVTADEARLRAHLFGEPRYAEAVLVCERDASGTERCSGFALYFHSYSTFLAKPGLYLEDIFVRPRFRGRGCGKALMLYLARLAVERGCGRFEWSVLDWNTPSIDFYRSLGAQPMKEWLIQRVSGPALERLARQPMPAGVLPPEAVGSPKP
jgi:GNAT superfamily N-acetyltransferase